jgi:3-oxoacyl-(acyl-carrier-protein) synthase
MQRSVTDEFKPVPLGGTSATVNWTSACVKAIEAGVMPPTIGLDKADPECDLDYVPSAARKKILSYVMSNSFALGAIDASLVFGAAG